MKRICVRKSVNRNLPEVAEENQRIAATATIIGVTLQAFMRDAENKETIVPFKITAPATCDLGDTFEEQLLRRYLPEWGIEKHANDLAAAA